MKILYLDFGYYGPIFEWKYQPNNKVISFLVWVMIKENIEVPSEAWDLSTSAVGTEMRMIIIGNDYRVFFFRHSLSKPLYLNA